MSPAIEAHGLTKAYGKHQVLAGLDLTVPAGTVYALLGRNGAGKTTTVRILATLSRPDHGHAIVAGFDTKAQRAKVRRAISLTGQYAALDETQTGAENLRMMARLSRLSRKQATARARQLLDQFHLGDAAKRQVGTYSGGMRRRLDLAASLVAGPSVIFLDEPTTGLDLPGRQAMWQTVTELTATGVTIFLTTQYLEEADRLASRIGVLNAGRLVAEGSPAELKGHVEAQRLDLHAASPAAYQELSSRLDGHGSHRDPAQLTIGLATDGSAAQVRALLDQIDPARDLVSDFAVHGATLDDVFLALTGTDTSNTAAASNATKETSNV